MQIDGQLIDAMAEYNQYYKSGLENDENPQDEFKSPLTDKLIHASLQGRLFIRPAGERTFRQIQTNVSNPQAEDADVTLSISKPMEKPLMPVAKLQESLSLKWEPGMSNLCRDRKSLLSSSAFSASSSGQNGNSTTAPWRFGKHTRL